MWAVTQSSSDSSVTSRPVQEGFYLPPLSPPNMHILISIQACACVVLTTFHKSAIHHASVASVLAADDNCCQDLTLLSQLAGQVGALLDNIKQGCLT